MKSANTFEPRGRNGREEGWKLLELQRQGKVKGQSQKECLMDIPNVMEISWRPSRLRAFAVNAADFSEA
jgi:hypothetical protein